MIMTKRRYFEILPAVLALVVLGMSNSFASFAEEKKPEKAPSSPTKANDNATKSSESASVTPATASVYFRAVRAKDPNAIVFTNDNLNEVAPMPPAADGNPPASPVAQDPTAPDGDPLVWMKEQEERGVERTEMLQAAEKELESARARLDNLKKQLLASTNPYSARPQLSEEEKELRATSGETAEQRRDRTRALVEQAEKDVVVAEDRVYRVKAQR